MPWLGIHHIVVETTENVKLKSQLAGIKGVLKARNEYVAKLVTELDARGRDLSRSYKTVQLQTMLLSSLPKVTIVESHTDKPIDIGIGIGATPNYSAGNAEGLSPNGNHPDYGSFSF